LIRRHFPKDGIKNFKFKGRREIEDRCFLEAMDSEGKQTKVYSCSCLGIKFDKKKMPYEKEDES